MAIDINIPSQVKNYANLAGFPATGSLKTIYIAEDTNKTYRWTGSAYVEISASQAASWGTITGTLSSQTDLNTALNGKVPTTRTLTINGTTQDLSADRTFTVSTGITIGTTAITSGTVGRVLFEGTGNVVSESANFFWDNTNGRLGINNASPQQSLDISGAMRIVTTGNYPISLSRASTSGVAQQVSNSGTTTYFGTDSTGGGFLFTGGLQYASFFGNGGNFPTQFGTNGAIRMTIFNDGNVGVNTTTNAGFKLDVNGTARVTQMTFPATLDKKIFLYEGINDYAIGLAAGAIRLGTPSGNRVAMGNYTGATFTEICNVSSTGLNLLSGRVDLGADTNNVKLAIYTSAGISMGLGVSAGTFRFSAGGTSNNFVFFDDAAGNKLYSLISLTGAGYYGSGTINASSQLQVDSTTRGFLPPRQTQAQRTAIASPAVGLVVYQTDGTEGLYVNKSTGWALLL